MADIEELRKLSADELDKALRAEDMSELSKDELIDRIGLIYPPDKRWRIENELRIQIRMMQAGWRDNPSRIAYVQGLSDSQLRMFNTGIFIGEAHDRIKKTQATLYEKLGYTMHGHTIDGGGVLSEGILHQVEDRGVPFASDAFNNQAWGRRRPGVV
ncbi:hypothetical protein ISS40_07955 [Candidatus Bathyarchaeota archaeon]|nr:hypothetical protein [Candidatus Bathyarchaeota archaeon]